MHSRWWCTEGGDALHPFSSLLIVFKIRINSRTFLGHSALVIPASGTNKVPNSGLSPKWDQNAKMVPKSPDFAHNSQISDFVIAVPYLDTHDVQGVLFNSPPKIVALKKLISNLKILISSTKISISKLKILISNHKILISGLKISYLILSSLKLSVSSLKISISGLKILISGLKILIFGYKTLICSHKI